MKDSYRRKCLSELGWMHGKYKWLEGLLLGCLLKNIVITVKRGLSLPKIKCTGFSNLCTKVGVRSFKRWSSTHVVTHKGWSGTFSM